MRALAPDGLGGLLFRFIMRWLQAKENAVEISRIFHGAQDWP
jgi:plasmid stabilization system protein ParE